MDFKSALADLLHGCVPELSAEEYQSFLEIPPNREMGDFAFPCFKLARVLRKAPPAIASGLKEQIEAGSVPGWISKIEVVGGYLNFFVNKVFFAKSVLDRILEEDKDYGRTDLGHGRTVCLDYSSINIAKPFHIGHLSSTVIGNSLYRIYNFLGYKSVGINHLGDWGTQFGKLIVAYRMWGNREEIEREGVRALLKIYVKFHDEAEKNPELDEEARQWFVRIEQHDPYAMELFNWFREITLKEVQRIYELLDVHFDSYAGESFYNDKLGSVIDELQEKGLLLESQGAKVVDLSDFNMPPCMILKADGASLYATRDIAAALYRKKTYNFEKCLYVVAYQQNLHFQQWFKVIELMGYDWYRDLEHVAFGMVSLQDTTLSTRHGNVVFLDDVLQRAIEKAAEIMQEKNPGLEDCEETAKQVGVGAVIFNTLFNSRIKDITFSFDRALNFDGETGPYVQYTHARICSVLKKAEGNTGSAADCSSLTDEESQVLLTSLSHFPEVVINAAQQNEPYLIVRYAVEVAQAFNRFYYEHRILCDDPAETNARLAATYATKLVLQNALHLIGIAAPERM